MQLVVFDLDGTITWHDTLLPYVVGFLGREPWSLPRLIGVTPGLAAYLVRRIDRGGLKAALLRHTLRGRTRAEIEAWNARYIPRLIARGVRAQALAAIESHRRAGDHLVLMSASVDLYVPEIGARLGFAESICTGVRWINERLDGELVTRNRRGEEKARCFRELKARFPGLRSVAYGNAASDLAHLALADEPRLVNGSRATRRAAARAGIAPYAQWR